MPLFEYACEACDHRFEVLQKFSDPPPECPSCGGKVGRLQSAPAIQFKGTGWYVTDYAKKGAKPSTEEKADKPEKKEKKAAAKTDSGSKASEKSSSSKDS